MEKPTDLFESKVISMSCHPFGELFFHWHGISFDLFLSLEAS